MCFLQIRFAQGYRNPAEGYKRLLPHGTGPVAPSIHSWSLQHSDCPMFLAAPETLWLRRFCGAWHVTHRVNNLGWDCSGLDLSELGLTENLMACRSGPIPN